MYKNIDHCCLILYCVFIYWLSNQQTLPTPHWVSFEDKFHHAGAYAVMACFAWRSFRHVLNLKPIILILVAMVFCSLYGASDEWHQAFVPGRKPSFGDWLADTIGAVLAGIAIYKYQYSKRLFSNC